MKKLYYLDEEEKRRILHLHESQTKKQYLMNEQELDEDVAGALYAGASGAAKGAAIGALGANPVTIAAGAVIGGAIGLISSIVSGMGRDAFNSTITQICSAGGTPIMNAGQFQDIAEKLNGLINTTNYIGGGYATTESREGIKTTLAGIPSIPDLCGVMKIYNELYSIDLLADLKREIYYDKYWTDTVKAPLMRAVNKTKEATAKAQEQQAKPETLVGWEKYTCVTSNQNAKKIARADGSVSYDINGVTYFGNGRKQDQTGKMSDYHCGTDGTIKDGPTPAAGGGTGGTGTGGTGGGYATRIQNIQKQLGIKTSGVMDQATIDAIANKIKGGGTKAAAPTASPTSDL